MGGAPPDSNGKYIRIEPLALFFNPFIWVLWKLGCIEAALTVACSRENRDAAEREQRNPQGIQSLNLTNCGLHGSLLVWDRCQWVSACAQQGLYDTLGIRYGRVNHFLSYDCRKAPPSVSSTPVSRQSRSPLWIMAMNACLFARFLRVWMPLGAMGSFSHMIAACGTTFTARDACELWYCK